MTNSVEDLLSLSGRVESAGLILAHFCGFIGLRLTRNENLSERVCRPCGRKIRNAAELYSFIEKAVSNTNVEDDLHWEAVEDRSKRQPPTTITPERSDVRKKCLKSYCEQLKEKRPRKVNSRKTLLQKARQRVNCHMQNQEFCWYWNILCTDACASNTYTRWTRWQYFVELL